MSAGLIQAIAAAALWLVAAPLAAQSFPAKPIRFVVPFPGGFSDVLARQVGARMSEALGQPVIVENKPGGSDQIGVQEVMRAPADGHTLFMGHIGTDAINAHLFAELAYAPDKDLVPVTLLATAPNRLVVHPSVPANTVQELVAYARKNPGKPSYASPGNGISGHLAAELFESLAKVFIVHIPYRGAAPALQDVMVRAGTPEAVVRRLNAELVKALDAPEMRAALVAQGATSVGNSPEAFAASIHIESARRGKLVREIGIRAD